MIDNLFVSGEITLSPDLIDAKSTLVYATSQYEPQLAMLQWSLWQNAL